MPILHHKSKRCSLLIGFIGRFWVILFSVALCLFPCACEIVIIDDMSSTTTENRPIDSSVSSHVSSSNNTQPQPPVETGEQPTPLLGSWSSEGPNVDYFDAAGNLAISGFSGEYYQFYADGSFKYLLGGSGPNISGIIFWQGGYVVDENIITLSNIRESWYPSADNRSGMKPYSDKVCNDEQLIFGWSNDGNLIIAEDETSFEKIFYKIK